MLNLDPASIDLTDMESSVLDCVNPYDVNPISGLRTASGTQDENISKPIKLEMEEFSDLGPYLPASTPKAMSNFTDELNTPIFDRKGPFNFMVSENTYIESPAAADPFKFEYDTIRTGNSVLSNKQLNDFSVYSNNTNVQLQESNNSEVVNIVQGSEANLLFTTSESDEGNIYIINGNETPIHVQSEDQFSASLFKIEDNSVVSVNSNENQYSNVSSPSNEYSVNTNIDSIEAKYASISSPNDDYCRKNLGIETPEDSNSSNAASEKSVKKVPKLKITMGFVNQAIALSTPDVIDSVVDLETSFNILDYVNEKDMTTVNIEDIHFEPSTSGELNIDPSTNKLRKRKIKRSDDDDEDYVPPTKKQSSRKVSVDSDSDSEAEEVSRSSKRGRPRRTSSISSEHSDASKYRELRDKNNEASRKSRLKRKMKELTLQKEAEELYEKNVKLKAQVAEYEKMVNNFRSNLFKIMLKK